MAVYFFDKDQTLIKIVPKSGTTEITQTRELPVDDSLMKDTLVVTAVADEKLLDAEYMAVSTVDDNAQSFDMYRIIDDTTPDTTMTFTGMQLGVYELEGKIIQDIRPTDHSVRFTVERLLSGTDWRLGYVADGLPNFTTNFYYISAKEALKSIQALTGAEFVFKVEISGNQITDKWVEVYREMGNRTQKRFNYGTNALTVVRETNKAEVYTALIGRGKGEEVSGAEDNASGQAGYGRKITFKDVTWSKSSGDPLDKPAGQNYLEYPEMTEVFGMKTIDGSMIPRIGVVDFDDEEDPENLLKLTYEQLIESSRPRVLFKTTVANIGKTGIGDTVSIHRHDLNIHYQTRVRKVVRNRLNDNKTQIELGDVVFTPSTQRTKNITNSVKNLARDITDTQIVVSETRLTADQKNNVTWGNVEPDRKRTGDLWYREHPSITGETQMLIWNGDSWELVLDSSDTNKVAREVERQTAKLNAFTEEIETVRERADEAIESAGGVASLADRHGELINNLRTDADNALANAGKALDNITDLSQSAQLRFQELSDEIDLRVDWDTLGQLDELLREQISEMYNFARFEDRRMLASFEQLMKFEVEAAQANAQELVESAENKFEQALDLKADQSALESLDQSVNHELEVLDDRLSLKANQITVDSLSDTVTVQKNRLDHTIEGLAFKADREDVDTLERTVTEQGNRITVNEQGLTQKADRSVVDDLNKTVEQQGLELRSTSEGLALKADRSTANNLSGRVSTAENNIKINADEISRRLTRNEVDNLVDGRGYATQTYVSNSVRETADGLNQLISSVRTTANGAVQRSSSDYQSLLQTSRLYERVLGSTQNNIESNISRVVQTSGLIQTEVQKAIEPEEISAEDPNIQHYVARNESIYINLTKPMERGKSYRIVLKANDRVKDFLVINAMPPSPYFSYTDNSLYETIFEYNGYGNDHQQIEVQNRGRFAAYYNVISVHEINPLISNTVRTVRTIQTQLDNSWAVQTLNSNDDILAQIAISDSTARIKGKNILLDGDVVVRDNLITNRMLASGITADKITTGTLDASRARIINLDVNSLTGNLTNFVQTNWNGIYSSIQMRSDGMSISDPNGNLTKLANGTMEFYYRGKFLGYIGSSVINEERTRVGGISINLEHDEGFMLAKKSSRDSGFQEVMQVRPHERNVRMNALLNMNHNINLSGYGLLRVNRMEMDYGSSRITGWGTRGISIEPQNNLRIVTWGSTAAEFLGSRIHFLRELNMNGNSIRNNSDRRLKRDIQATEVDSLSAISRWKFVDYNWIDDTLNSRQGRQLGLIAQDTPEISDYDRYDDTWNINSSKQMMMNSHAIQQLANDSNTKFKTQEDQIFELQQELSKANRRIKELEEAK